MGLAMALCVLGEVLFSAWEGQPPNARSCQAIIGAAAITAALGALTKWWAGPEPSKPPRFGRRDAVIAVSAVWVAITLTGTLPYLMDTRLPIMDALFESTSGFTTTGATILTDIEGTASRPLLLWRSVTQWLGGMGIVVLFVAIFPNLGVGGKHMFRSEMPGVQGDDLRPRIRKTSSILWRIYVVLTLVTLVAYYLAGMNGFESTCHALTTMATGGFSTRTDSIGAFNNPTIELVACVFMLIGGVNFALYYAAIRTRRLRVFWQSTEFRVYALMILLCVLMLTGINLAYHEYMLEKALRRSLFVVSAFITSTGYGTDAYMDYPQASVMIVVVLMFVGGCSGSTSGGLKLSRFIIMAKASWGMIRRSVRPSVVQVVRLDRKALPSPVLLEIAALLFVYMLFLFGGTFLVALIEPVPLPTAFGTMLSSLSNMGPYPFHLEADNFAGYKPITKGFFSICMVIGRLEFFTVLALFLPDIWRR